MRTARDSNGVRLLISKDFLSTQQVSSYFSRMAKKQRSVPDDVNQGSDSEDDDDSSHSELENELRAEVFTEDSVQHSHPIIYDTYNICQLIRNSNTMLRDICEAFGLETSIITIKRKQPYITLLNELVEGCSCSI